MQLQPIPAVEHSQLVHSTNAIIDTTYVANYVQPAALHQLDQHNFSIEQIFSYVVRTVLILKNNRNIDYLDEFKLFLLNDIDHMLESDIAERHRRFVVQSGGIVTITVDGLINTVMDTIFKLYKIYNHLFCNIFSELSSTCAAIGFPSSDFKVHSLNIIAPQTVNIVIGCYA